MSKKLKSKVNTLTPQLTRPLRRPMMSCGPYQRRRRLILLLLLLLLSIIVSTAGATLRRRRRLDSDTSTITFSNAAYTQPREPVKCDVNKAFTDPETGPLLGGIDIVAYYNLSPSSPAVPGNTSIWRTFENYTFLFSSEQNARLFDADPQRYLPAWGGFCSWGIAAGNVPLNVLFSRIVSYGSCWGQL